MINIKEGKDVQTKGDLQNLVTSVFLRQSTDFCQSDILSGLNKRLEGSEWFGNPEVETMVKETLHILFINDCLKNSDKGKGYYKLSMSFPSIV